MGLGVDELSLDLLFDTHNIYYFVTVDFSIRPCSGVSSFFNFLR